MRWDTIIFYMFLGWLIGWTVKYIVVGLRRWDSIFHQERLLADTTGPYKMFADPLLGVLA